MKISGYSKIVQPVVKINKDKNKQSFQEAIMKGQKSKRK